MLFYFNIFSLALPGSFKSALRSLLDDTSYVSAAREVRKMSFKVCPHSPWHVDKSFDAFDAIVCDWLRENQAYELKFQK